MSSAAPAAAFPPPPHPPSDYPGVAPAGGVSQVCDQPPPRMSSAAPAESVSYQEELKKQNKAALDAKALMHEVSASMKAVSSYKYSLANFMFLFVILGIEMDMCGLLCSIPVYWDYDELVLRGFLFYGLVAFFYAILKAFLEDQRSAEDASVDVEQNGSDSEGPSNLVGKMLSQMKALNPFGSDFLIYHWFPGLRLFLFTKRNTTMSDVVAVLKINTLSSFSLGLFQLIGIGYTFWHGYELNIFVKLNIASQCLNWFITILYFLTPIAAWMGNAAQVKQQQQFFQGVKNDWAMMLTKEYLGLHDSNKRETMNKKKRLFKEGLAHLIIDKFLSSDQDGSATRQHLLSLLLAMRDADVNDYINTCQNHVIAGIG